MSKWKVIIPFLFVLAVLFSPMILNYSLNLGDKEWLGFWGSYLGSLIASCIALYSLITTYSQQENSQRRSALPILNFEADLDVAKDQRVPIQSLIAFGPSFKLDETPFRGATTTLLACHKIFGEGYNYLHCTVRNIGFGPALGAEIHLMNGNKICSTIALGGFAVGDSKEYFFQFPITEVATNYYLKITFRDILDNNYQETQSITTHKLSTIFSFTTPPKLLHQSSIRITSAVTSKSIVQWRTFLKKPTSEAKYQRCLFISGILLAYIFSYTSPPPGEYYFYLFLILCVVTLYIYSLFGYLGHVRTTFFAGNCFSGSESADFCKTLCLYLFPFALSYAALMYLMAGYSDKDSRTYYLIIIYMCLLLLILIIRNYHGRDEQLTLVITTMRAAVYLISGIFLTCNVIFEPVVIGKYPPSIEQFLLFLSDSNLSNCLAGFISFDTGINLFYEKIVANLK